MKRVLLIVNPHAGSVSARKKEVIVKALQSDFKLDVAETKARGHASELGKQAVEDGFDAVVAMGGDGTLNESAQSLVGSDVALGILPLGSTNVLARSLGVPTDPVEATAYLGTKLLAGDVRRIGVGRFNDRYFLLTTGMGIDAEVVKRVESDPHRHKHKREWVFMKHAWKTGVTDYRTTEPHITVEAEGHEPVRCIFYICANARPWTYFKRWPVDACPQATLDGKLDMFALSKLRLLTAPRVAWSVFVSRTHPRWKNSHYFHDVAGFRIKADRPLPAQVDGDFIGHVESADIKLVPDALNLLA
jgi:diacylglycerol kinase family enzyme